MVNGIPILGSVTGLRSILAAQSIACLIISSRHIKADRLDQAIRLCQEWRIPILHAYLKLEPLVLEPEGAALSTSSLLDELPERRPIIVLLVSGAWRQFCYATV